MRSVDLRHRLLRFVAAPSAGWTYADTGYAMMLAITLVLAGFLISIVDLLAEAEIVATIFFLDVLTPAILLSGLWLWMRRRRIANTPGATS